MGIYNYHTLNNEGQAIVAGGGLIMTPLPQPATYEGIFYNEDEDITTGTVYTSTRAHG